jgi:hypothetical protein
MSRRTCATRKYLLASVAFSYTPVGSLTAVLDAARENENGGHVLDALLTHV